MEEEKARLKKMQEENDKLYAEHMKNQRSGCSCNYDESCKCVKKTYDDKLKEKKEFEKKTGMVLSDIPKPIPTPKPKPKTKAVLPKGKRVVKGKVLVMKPKPKPKSQSVIIDAKLLNTLMKKLKKK